MRHKHIIQGISWLAIYLAMALAPLLIVLLAPGDLPPGRDVWTEFSVALGFVGMAMMTLQFALTARFEWLKAPYGSDVVYAFHRQISIVSVVFILAHPIILLFVRTEDMLVRLNPLTAPWPARLGLAAVACLIGLVIISLWRKALKIEYDLWRRTHAILAMAAIALGAGHIWLINHYLASPAQRWLWLAYTVLFVGLIVYVRLIKPAIESFRPYVVQSVTAQPGECTAIVVAPDGHEGLKFQPGQFAWLTAFGSPFSDREHPFSFSGSSERSELEFTIKRRGDFTRRIPELKAGDRVYVDGPFGALSADRHPDAKGFVFIAGGIGITPMLSHLRTFADRSNRVGEKRALVLIYGVKSLEDATYLSEIESLRQKLNLTFVLVPSTAPETWAGERGFITSDLLRRHLPKNNDGSIAAGHECFICGPDPMMDAVELALAELGVERGSYHSERFDLV